MYKVRRPTETSRASRILKTSKNLPAREIPEGLLELIGRGNIHSGSFLWEDQPEYGPLLEIPAQFTGDK
jgi:hypothetical protein